MEELQVYTSRTDLESVREFICKYYTIKEYSKKFLTPFGYNLTNIIKERYPKTLLSSISRTNHELFKKTTTRRGKHDGGTYCQDKDFLKFILLIDVNLQVSMDWALMDIIANYKVLKIERANTKALFHPLTDTIKNYYIQNQQSDNAKKFAYSSLLTMINMIVLGSTSKKYATANSIEIEKGKTIRDYLGQDKLEEIKKLEEHLNGLILYGKIYKYDTLKEELIKFN